MDYSFMGSRNDQGSFQANPAFLQFLSQMGSNFGQGQSAGQAIGDATSQALRMKQLYAGQQQPGQTQAQPQQGGQGDIYPTPLGTPGPNAVKENIVRTADGVKRTMTVEEPSATSPSYPSPQTPEAMPGQQAPQSSPQGGVSEQSPFWRALLSQRG